MELNYHPNYSILSNRESDSLGQRRHKVLRAKHGVEWDTEEIVDSVETRSRREGCSNADASQGSQGVILRRFRYPLPTCASWLP